MEDKHEIIVPDGMELNNGDYIIVSLRTDHVVYRCTTPEGIEEWLDSQIDGHPYVGYKLKNSSLKLVALRFRVWESDVECEEEYMTIQ
jgi:hypothetical protein